MLAGSAPGSTLPAAADTSARCQARWARNRVQGPAADRADAAPSRSSSGAIQENSISSTLNGGAMGGPARDCVATDEHARDRDRDQPREGRRRPDEELARLPMGPRGTSGTKAGEAWAASRGRARRQERHPAAGAGAMPDAMAGGGLVAGSTGWSAPRAAARSPRRAFEGQVSGPGWSRRGSAGGPDPASDGGGGSGSPLLSGDAGREWPGGGGGAVKVAANDAAVAAGASVAERAGLAGALAPRTVSRWRDARSGTPCCRSRCDRRGPAARPGLHALVDDGAVAGALVLQIVATAVERDRQVLARDRDVGEHHVVVDAAAHGDGLAVQRKPRPASLPAMTASLA